MLKRTLHSGLVLGTLLTCTLILSHVAVGQLDESSTSDGASEERTTAEREQQVRDLYQEGVKLLKNEKLDQAYTTFQKAIETARNIEPETRGSLLRWLWHSTSTRMFDKMLADPNLKHAAERIMELAKGAYWTWKMEDSRIRRLVNNLTTDDYKLRMESQRKLQSAGQYAAPALIEELKADNTEMRSMAIQTLANMDSRVTLPVVEALESSSRLQRKNAAIVLGHLQDPRALPALKRMHEQEEEEIVRAEAKQAIMKILMARLPSYLRDQADQLGAASVEEVLRKSDFRSVGYYRSPDEMQDHTHALDTEKAQLQIRKNGAGLDDGTKAPSANGGTDVDPSDLINPLQWVKSPEQKKKLKKDTDKPEKPAENNREKGPSSSKRSTWEGAERFGLKDVYIDRRGLKYVLHSHDQPDKRSVGPHRHYLRNIKGLPRELTGYINRWKALRITLSDPQTFDNLVSSHKLYHRLAEHYYLAHPSVMNQLYGDALVWSWDEETQRAEARKVPQFMFNEELAVQACLDGLEVKVDYHPLWPLMVNTYFAMYNDSNIMLSRGEEYVKLNVLSQKSLERMQKDLQTRDQMSLAGRMTSTPVLYAALAQSLEDEKPLVAVSNLNVLDDFVDTSRLPAADFPGWRQREALGYPLITALKYPDRRVRYRAASMLVTNNPQEPFLHSDRVVPTLAEAVSTAGIRLITYASRNQEEVNRFRTVMNDPNLRAEVRVARNAQDLLRFSKSSPVSDMIVVDGDLISSVLYSYDIPGREPYQQRVIDALKDDVRTRAVPLVVVADDGTEKSEIQETYGDRIDVVVEGPLNVRKMLDQFEEHRQELVQGNLELQIKELAERLALMSANALHSINPRDTIFNNYKGAVPALFGTLKDRPDDLRIASAKTLGRFGDPRAIRPLMQTLDRQGDATDVRVAAGMALAKIFQQNNTEPSKQTLELLIQNASQGPIKVQMAANRAFGETSISEEKRLKLLRMIRNNQIGSPAGSARATEDSDEGSEN